MIIFVNEKYIKINQKKCTKIRQKKLHREIMERHIGRELNANELVHHINEDRQDNRIENLKIVTHKEHAQIHLKVKRIILEFVCAFCGTEFKREMTPQKLNYIKTHNQTKFFCSKECSHAHQIKNKKSITKDEATLIAKGIAEGLNMNQISKKYKIKYMTVYQERKGFQ